ncbi:MAG: DUF1700 domain-containing protein [Ruminococcus sp.]|nr:DUF1700 domain-containing protein [Ruminococcus sp.]
MTKKQYLNNLSENLRFRLPQNDIKEIISDMGEYFDDALSEGTTEEDICAKLGDPVTAAAELVQKRGGSGISALRPIMPDLAAFAVNVFLWTVYILFIGSNPLYYVILPLLPVLMWVIFERKDSIKSISAYPADGYMTAAAALLVLSGFSSIMLYHEAYGSENSMDEGFMLLTCVFLIAALGFWAASMIKGKKEKLLVLPTAGAVMTVWAAAVSNDFFGANAIGFGFVTQEERRSRYMGYMGKYCLQFFCIIIAISLAMLIYTNLVRNALTLPASELLAGVFAAVVRVVDYLRRFDPMDVKRFPETDMRGAVIGISAALVLLAVTAVLRTREKRERA